MDAAQAYGDAVVEPDRDPAPRSRKTLLHLSFPMFVQSLAVAGVVSDLVVLAVGDNHARGIGLVGALTVIRFRSTLKDPRDLSFAFASLATGVAAGAHAYAAAVLGTVV